MDILLLLLAAFPLMVIMNSMIDPTETKSKEKEGNPMQSNKFSIGLSSSIEKAISDAEKAIKDTEKVLNDNKKEDKTIEGNSIFKGDLPSYKGKTVTRTRIINEESFIIRFDDGSELTVELDQEYKNLNRPPRYSLFCGNLNKLSGGKVKETELLEKGGFKIIFEDDDELIVTTEFVDENSKEKNRTLKAILKTRKKGDQITLF